MEGCLRRCLGFALGMSCLLAPMIAFADAVNNEWYSPLRTLTRGNVGIATSDDADTSMFYNPAGLAAVRKKRFEYFNPLFEAGFNDFGLGGGSSAGIGKNSSLAAIQPQLAQHPYRASSLGASLFPNFQAQNFDFGVVMSGHGDSYMDSAGTLHYHSRYLLVPTLGMAVGLLGGRWKLGVGIRGVQMAMNDRETTNFGGIGYRNDTSEGFGLGIDVGTQFTLAAASLPTIGLVARNLGGTSFSGNVVKLAQSSVGEPATIKPSYDGGIAFKPRLGRKNFFTFASDYRDALNTTHTPTLRHVNIGTGFSFYDIVFFHGGFRSGYWTAGLGVQGKYGSLDLGTYADELDNHGWHKVQDRRFGIQFGNRF